MDCHRTIGQGAEGKRRSFTPGPPPTSTVNRRSDLFLEHSKSNVDIAHQSVASVATPTRCPWMVHRATEGRPRPSRFTERAQAGGTGNGGGGNTDGRTEGQKKGRAEENAVARTPDSAQLPLPEARVQTTWTPFPASLIFVRKRENTRSGFSPHEERGHIFTHDYRLPGHTRMRCKWEAERSTVGGVSGVCGLLVTGRKTGGGSPCWPRGAAQPQRCPLGPWRSGKMSPGRDKSHPGLLRKTFSTPPPKSETPLVQHIWP